MVRLDEHRPTTGRHVRCHDLAWLSATRLPALVIHIPMSEWPHWMAVSARIATSPALTYGKGDARTLAGAEWMFAPS